MCIERHQPISSTVLSHEIEGVSFNFEKEEKSLKHKLYALEKRKVINISKAPRGSSGIRMTLTDNGISYLLELLEKSVGWEFKI